MSGDFNLLEAYRAVFSSQLAPLEKLVALALLNHWSKTRDTFPSADRLAKWTSLCKRSVLRSLVALEAKGAIVVTRSSGRANRYELGSLMALTSDSQSLVSDGHQCPTDTGPVPHSHQGGDSQSPEEIHRRDPSKRSKKSARAGARRRAPKVEVPLTPEQSANHASITKLYFERFEAARGEKPSFDSQDGKAVKELLAKCGPEKAAKAIEGAFGSWWKDKATIRSIAKEPSKFIGAKPDNSKSGRMGVQNDSTVEELADHAARVRAATGRTS